MESCERWMRWGAEIGIKVSLRGRWWKRSPHIGPEGKTFGHMRDMKTWWKISSYEEELLMLNEDVTVFVGFLDKHHSIYKFWATETARNARMDLYSPGIHITCHGCQFSKSDPLTLISAPSSPLFVSCLLLIAIRVTWAHTGDCLITHSFSTCPSIIQLMQSFMWPFQSMELQPNSGSCDRGFNISFMTLLLRSFYYLEFTSHLLSMCCLNGPFISFYVATKLSVERERDAQTSAALETGYGFVKFLVWSKITCWYNKRKILCSIRWHFDNNMLLYFSFKWKNVFFNFKTRRLSWILMDSANEQLAYVHGLIGG